ncbi:MAG: helix-turn-helix transcriptional regulator [Oscillospiraceae bacterium]|nr:helix-turn-helix transcriptional regulator [Oscillospiraceae bacterium]
MDAVKTGKLIRAQRVEQGLTQQGLADALNLSATAISKWENGHSLPDIAMLEALSEVLGISITEIVTGERAAAAVPAAEADAPGIAEEPGRENRDADAAIKSVIRESLRQRRKGALRCAGIALAIAAILFAAFYFLYFRGFSAPRDAVDLTVGIEQTGGTENGGPTWVIRFVSRDGRGLRVRSKHEFGETGDVIRLYVYETAFRDAAEDAFTWGCVGGQPGGVDEAFDQIIRVKCRDQEIIYSMREEGLFDENG